MEDSRSHDSTFSPLVDQFLQWMDVTSDRLSPTHAGHLVPHHDGTEDHTMVGPPEPIRRSHHMKHLAAPEHSQFSQLSNLSGDITLSLSSNESGLAIISRDWMANHQSQPPQTGPPSQAEISPIAIEKGLVRIPSPTGHLVAGEREESLHLPPLGEEQSKGAVLSSSVPRGEVLERVFVRAEGGLCACSVPVWPTQQPAPKVVKTPKRVARRRQTVSQKRGRAKDSKRPRPGSSAVKSVAPKRKSTVHMPASFGIAVESSGENGEKDGSPTDVNAAEALLGLMNGPTPPAKHPIAAPSAKPPPMSSSSRPANTHLPLQASEIANLLLSMSQGSGEN